MAISRSRPGSLPEHRFVDTQRTGFSEWSFYLQVAALVLIAVWAPILFAFLSAPPDRQFMGVLEGIPDHNQYFAWMRSLATEHLAANRLTPEPNDPGFFNLLWWSVGRFSALTGLSYITVYTLLRLVAMLALFAAIIFFLQIAVTDSRQRRLAFFFICTGSGLGIVWVVVKYAAGLADVPFPGDVYTAEANTLLLMQVFPHFTLALTLITSVFGLMLLAVQTQQLRYAILAGIAGAALALQHAYDLLTVYTVLGSFGFLVWARDRRFPTFLFRAGLILAALATPPALYLAYLVANDAAWGRKLEQFDNAGVFTPSPPHLFILLGIPLVLALAALRPRMFQSRNNAELLVATWFVAHFPLMYLPVKFQIHLILGIQIPMMILAAGYVINQLVPVLQRRTKLVMRGTLALLVGLSVVTSVYLIAWRFVYLARYEQPFYLTNDEIATLTWLEQATSRDDVVLADIELGQFVPVWSDARAYLAHWAGTLDFFTKREQAALVLDPATSAQVRNQLLDEFAVTYVVVREQDSPRSAFARSAGSRLREVYTHGTVTVYAVQREQRAEPDP